MPWTSGLDNMFEWTTWYTYHVLGVTKTQYWKQVLGWCEEEAAKSLSLEEKEALVTRRLKAASDESEQIERYSRKKAGIAKPHEALRRAKFFSEDFLNKEFDVFMALASDQYLNQFYGRFASIQTGGSWATHGQSQRYEQSTLIPMQMDNLAYNRSEGILVANELKLEGGKNRDQILKYAVMFKLLREKGFIDEDTRFLLLFIGSESMGTRWKQLIDDEIAYCKTAPTGNHEQFIQPDVLEIANSSSYASTTWLDIIRFNEDYAENLDPVTQEVEHKLLMGFNQTLRSKAAMQETPSDGVAE